MRECQICSVENDDKYYHYSHNDGMTCWEKTYCGKKVNSWPHEWASKECTNGSTPLVINHDLTERWDKMKMCPACLKRRTEEEQSAWGL